LPRRDARALRVNYTHVAGFLEEGCRATVTEDQRLEAIRRQLDADYTAPSTPAAPTRRSNMTRMVIGGVLLGCVLGGAVAAVAMFFYLQQPDAPADVRRDPSRLKPAPTLSSPSVTSPTRAPSQATPTMETPSSTAATAATDRAHDTRQPTPAASSSRPARQPSRAPAHQPQAPPKSVEAP